LLTSKSVLRAAPTRVFSIKRASSITFTYRF
jgi:hypothetical protein